MRVRPVYWDSKDDESKHEGHLFQMRLFYTLVINYAKRISYGVKCVYRAVAKDIRPFVAEIAGMLSLALIRAFNKPYPSVANERAQIWAQIWAQNKIKEHIGECSTRFDLSIGVLQRLRGKELTRFLCEASNKETSSSDDEVRIDLVLGLEASSVTGLIVWSQQNRARLPNSYTSPSVSQVFSHVFGDVISLAVQEPMKRCRNI